MYIKSLTEPGNCEAVCSDLVTLCASIQKALLDGKLQQVVILVPHWFTAARTKSSVVWRGLKHRGVHLTVEGSGGTLTCCKDNITLLNLQMNYLYKLTLEITHNLSKSSILKPKHKY